MTEETQAAEPTAKERAQAWEAFEVDVLKVMRCTSSRTLIQVRDKLPAEAYTHRAIINARLRILRGLD